jgi:hypothetical protein|nr:hypothetical protein [uncultured Psychroserpens sp.]
MKIKFLVLVLITLSIVSCSSDDGNAPSSNDEEQSFTVIRDGVTFQGENINNTLIRTTQNDQGARRLDLRCDFDGGTLVLSISNWEFQNPPDEGVVEKSYNTNTDMGPDTECETIDSITFCDEALVTYLIGNDVYISELNDSDIIGDITIVSNNSQDKRITGTFDVLLRDFNGGEEEVYIEHSGTFDVSYIVF